MRPVLLTLVAVAVLILIVAVLTPAIKPSTHYQGVSFERLAKISQHVKKPGKRTCHIKTIAWMDTFVHELAHCNGWDHPKDPTAAERIPSEKFIRAFRGRLIVTIGEGGKPDDILKYAQKEITVRLSDKPVSDICAYSYERHPSQETLDYYRNVAGCAPVGGD